MLERLKCVLLYSGVDRISYERIKPKIQKANLTMVIVSSTIATILITAMFISSFNSDGIKQNKYVYAVGLILSLTILFLSKTIAKTHCWVITLLIYLSYSIYYIYGILIGTITDPNGKTVTFMVLLVFMPILFVNSSLHTILISSCYICIFIILCMLNKEGKILSVDIIDAVVFGILGLVTGTVINNIKVKGYTLEQKLQELGNIDQLTKVKNRNAYEIEKNTIPCMCKSFLACIYIDVNGLHEINKEKGHEFGDKMLKQIALEVKNALSDEFTYRIGGDEFISFIPDLSIEELEKIIDNMVKRIELENYHVAIGYEVASTRHLSLEALIKKAEGKMFCNKKMYYKNNESDRDVRSHKYM